MILDKEILEFKCEKFDVKVKYLGNFDRHMNRQHKKMKIKRNKSEQT